MASERGWTSSSHNRSERTNHGAAVHPAGTGILMAHDMSRRCRGRAARSTASGNGGLDNGQPACARRAGVQSRRKGMRVKRPALQDGPAVETRRWGGGGHVEDGRAEPVSGNRDRPVEHPGSRRDEFSIPGMRGCPALMRWTARSRSPDPDVGSARQEIASGAKSASRMTMKLTAGVGEGIPKVALLLGAAGRAGGYSARRTNRPATRPRRTPVVQERAGQAG